MGELPQLWSPPFATSAPLCRMIVAGSSIVKGPSEEGQRLRVNRTRSGQQRCRVTRFGGSRLITDSCNQQLFVSLSAVVE